MSKSSVLLARDPHAWVTKAAAAARLRCSLRTVERHISEGRLRTRLEQVAGRKPLVLVDPADLSALLSAGTPALVPAAVVPAPAAAAPAGMADLLRAIAAAGAAPAKPWLTLDEAAEYSGLPRGWLLAQARAGSAMALNVSMCSRESYRFSRRGLRGLR